jgi:peptidoglycan/LPS O-acetylase OafA/YrhL
LLRVTIIITPHIYYIEAPFVVLWVLPFTHFDSILFGLLLGLGILDPILDKIPPLVTGLTGLLLLALISFLPDFSIASWIKVLSYFFLTGLGMALILYTVLRTSNLLGMRWISSKPVAFLGKISYGLYVYHLLCIGVITEFFRIASTAYWTWRITVFVLPLLATIALSSFSYIFIEKPFLRLKDRFSIVLSRPV